MSALGDAICKLLTGCRGIDAAMTAQAIAQAVGSDERTVRGIIAAESSKWPQSCGLLLAQPAHGFFFASQAEEVQHRQASLIRLKLEAATKVSLFQAEMRRHGFGGLVSNSIPETFTNASQPAKEDRHTNPV